MERNRLLIVDDSELDLAILNEIFKSQFSVSLLSNMQTALTYVSQHKAEIAAVIVDVQLARHSSGVTLLQKIHGIQDADSIPVILITSDAHEDIVLEGMQCGAIDFLAKPVNPLVVQERVKNIVLTAWGSETPSEPECDLPPDDGIPLHEADALARRWQTKMMRVCQYRKLDFLQYIDHIKVLTQVIADSYIKKHPNTGLTGYHAELMGYASCFAEIGQIFLPDDVIAGGPHQPEPGRSIYNRHTIIGQEIFDGGLSDWEPFLTYCKEMALYHHEEYDGTGLPSHLRGNEIPLSAQLVHGAQILDELFRQFARNKDAIERIFDQLRPMTGKQLSPALADAIMAIPEQLETVLQLYRN